MRVLDGGEYFVSLTNAVFMRSLFGFLLGSVLAGGGLYYYVIDEYKVSNELLTEDIYVCLSLLSQRPHEWVADSTVGTASGCTADRGLRQISRGGGEDEEVSTCFWPIR